MVIVSIFTIYVLFVGSFFRPAVQDKAELRVAVASNFFSTMAVLANRFEAESGVHVVVISGSTGKHYAQIKNGAPYDLFFAADTLRPALLEEEHRIVPGSRFTYAFGKMVLWSRQTALVDSSGGVLQGNSSLRIAIANPEVAPYGRAAREILQHVGVWDQMRKRLIRGENIGQVFHFTYSGSADLGFVALSQVTGLEASRKGSYWNVPQSLYTPINQQAVRLSARIEALEFVQYIRSIKGRRIIRNSGYGTP